MTGRHLHSIGEISAMLAARMETLAAELFPAGRRQGAEWTVGSLAGEPGRKLSIRLRGDKAGVWKDFAGGESGDALDLVAAARFGGNLPEALRWARLWLGLADGALPAGQAPAPRPRAPDPERNDDGHRQKARALWLGGQPLPGSPADAYLEGRGVGVDRLQRAPNALRFRPDVWCGERRMNAPAMVASIVREGRIVACHRTFLAPGPAGRWTKAPIAAAKKVLGPMRGGFIPLHRGLSMRPLAEAPEDDVLAIAEGIEDALTVALHMPEWRVVAAVSLGNIASLVLPERFQDLVLVCDRDGDNPAARQGIDRAAETLLRQNRSVREVRPPQGWKDFNAWHMAEISAGGQDARREA
jgi:hypothetical protein